MTVGGLGDTADVLALTLNDAQQTGAVTISGGAGDDKIIGGGGAGAAVNDFLTGGAGADLFCYRQAAGADGNTTISDFTAGTYKIGIGTPLMSFAGVAGTMAAPVAIGTANFQTRADETAIVVGDTLKVVSLTSFRTMAQITTGLGAAANAVVVAFNSTTGVAEVYYDPDWSSAAGRVRLATLSNITTLAGTTAIAAGDFVEID